MFWGNPSCELVQTEVVRVIRLSRVHRVIRCIIIISCSSLLRSWEEETTPPFRRFCEMNIYDKFTGAHSADGTPMR